MKFATEDDTIPATGTPAMARIAAITIKGQVLGTATGGDFFGFVAQSIGPVKIAGILYTGGAVPVDLSTVTPDVLLRLIPA